MDSELDLNLGFASDKGLCPDQCDCEIYNLVGEFGHFKEKKKDFSDRIRIVVAFGQRRQGLTGRGMRKVSRVMETFHI